MKKTIVAQFLVNIFPRGILQPNRLLPPRDFQASVQEWVANAFYKQKTGLVYWGRGNLIMLFKRYTLSVNKFLKSNFTKHQKTWIYFIAHPQSIWVSWANLYSLFILI